MVDWVFFYRAGGVLNVVLELTDVELDEHRADDALKEFMTHHLDASEGSWYLFQERADTSGRWIDGLCGAGGRLEKIVEEIGVERLSCSTERLVPILEALIRHNIPLSPSQSSTLLTRFLSFSEEERQHEGVDSRSIPVLRILVDDFHVEPSEPFFGGGVLVLHGRDMTSNSTYRELMGIQKRAGVEFSEEEVRSALEYGKLMMDRDRWEMVRECLADNGWCC
ncbi:hypothetical protein HDV00_008381 [Rhizophlyctis rosea]|nr:hypothetical protein HDV00_008381 [Rhizophlyctis rosea]